MNSTSSRRLFVKFVKYDSHFFSQQIINVWNYLPPDIVDFTSLNYRIGWFVIIFEMFLTRVLQGEEGNLPQTRFSHHCTKTVWNFLKRFRDFSKTYIGYRIPKDFSHICYCPQILVGNKGHPRWRKLVLSVTRVRRAADGKIWRVYPCFHVQSSQCDSGADFSWRHMQTGSGNPPKTGSSNN